jgi:hypothetical protein
MRARGALRFTIAARLSLLAALIVAGTAALTLLLAQLMPSQP